MIDLENFTSQDIDELITWITSERELVTWGGTRFQWPLDRAQLENYITRRLANNIQYIIFKALHSETKEMVGHIELATIDFNNLSATIVHVLVKPELRNKGYGTEMTRKVLEFAFDYLHLHRVDLIVLDSNKPAVTCYQKLGFKEEGCMRDSKRYRQEYWSVLLMSMLDHEWQAMGKNK